VSFFSTVFSPFEKVVSAVEALVPQDLITKYGAYAHTIVANIAYDAKVALKAGVLEAETLSKPLIASVVAAIEAEAESLAPQVLSGKLSFASAIAAAVGNLKSVAVASVIPGLKVVGEETLTTILRTAGATAIATLAANPTVPVASSSAGLSPAPSKA